MDDENDPIQAVLAMSQTRKGNSSFLLRDMLDYYLRSMVESRIKGLIHSDEKLVELQADRARLASAAGEYQRIIGLGDSVQSIQGPGGLMSIEDAIRKHTLIQIQLSDVEAAYGYWQHDYQEQMKLVVDHVRLVGPNLEGFSDIEIFKFIWPKILSGFELSAATHVGVPEKKNTVIALLDGHKTYFDTLIAETDHENNERNYFTIEMIDFLKRTFLEYGADHPVQADTDQKLLLFVHRKYYNK